MGAFSPQMYVVEKLQEAKLQWKKEKLNNIGVLQKKVLVPCWLLPLDRHRGGLDTLELEGDVGVGADCAWAHELRLHN